MAAFWRVNLLSGARRGRRTAGSSVATAALVTIGACSPSAVLVNLAPITPAPTGEHNIGQFVWTDLATMSIDDPGSSSTKLDRKHRKLVHEAESYIE